MTVIDTDTNCIPHLDHLKVRGATAIGRYYARSASWKRLTKDEAQAISEAGLELFVVYEDSGDPVLSIDRGRSDAQIAYSQARAIGQPEGSAIYFAMEHLPHGYGPEHIDGIKLYFEGIRRTLKDLYKVGCYSNGDTLAALLDAKLIDYAWVSASTSFAGSKAFLATDRWVLAQRKVDLNWGGVSTDINDVKGEFGAFTLPSQAGAEIASVVERDEAGVSTAAVVSMPPPQGGGDLPPQKSGERSSFWDRFNFKVLDELAEKGSRTATSLKSFKGILWKGTATTITTGGAAATLVDPNKGTAQIVGSWGEQHPFLLAAICAGVVAVVLIGIAYYFAKKIEKGLAAAAKDGRYSPRGANQ
jgi:hypothetical protein